MSYSYDKLHLDMIDVSHGENTDAVVHLDGHRYRVVGVEPELDAGGCLVLKIKEVAWPAEMDTSVFMNRGLTAPPRRDG
jgi:hypothetical protein